MLQQATKDTPGRRRDRDPPALRFRALSATGIRENLARRRRSLSRRRRSSSVQRSSAGVQQQPHKRLGIRPTLYNVNESYVQGDENTNNTNTNSERRLFRGKQKATPYGKTWNESQGVVHPMRADTDSPSSSPTRKHSEHGTPATAANSPPSAAAANIITPISLAHPNVTPRASRESYQKKHQHHEHEDIISRRITELESPLPIISVESLSNSTPTANSSTSTKKSTTSSTRTTVSDKITSVNIFLLLVAPQSKVFELIDLTYPRSNTTIADLLSMIPRHATEQVLSQQRYIGFTRPKKHHQQPLTDLRMLASNNIHVAETTANLCHGEVIVAIPTHTSARQMVQLARPILRNPRILALMASKRLAATTTTMMTKSSTTSSIHSVTACSEAISTTPITDDGDVGATPPLLIPVPHRNTNNNNSMDQLINRDIVCGHQTDELFDYCEQRQRDVVGAHHTPVVDQRRASTVTDTELQADYSATPTDTASLCDSVATSVSMEDYTARVKQWARRVQARKRKWIKVLATARKYANLLFLLSIVWYRLDRQHHHDDTTSTMMSTDHQHDTTTNVPMAIACFCLLVHTQRWWISLTDPVCPFVMVLTK